MNPFRTPSLRRGILASVFTVPLLTISARAQSDFDWKTTGSAWNAAGNWSPAGVPGASDLATFSPHRGGGATALDPVLGGDRAIDTLLFGNSFLGEVFSINGGGALNDLTVSGSNGFGLPAAVTVRNFLRFDDVDYFYDQFFGQPAQHYTLQNAGTLTIGAPNVLSPGAAIDIGHGGIFALNNAAAELNGGALAMHGGALVLDDGACPARPPRSAARAGFCLKAAARCFSTVREMARLPASSRRPRGRSSWIPAMRGCASSSAMDRRW